MPYKKTGDRRNIVLIGGGVIGVVVGRALSAKLDRSRYNIILIDKRPFRVLLPASLRMVVSDEGHLEDQLLVDFGKLFINGNGSFIQGTVESVVPSTEGKGGYLSLADGEKIEYEVLVLGTGAEWKGPLAFPNELSDAKRFINEGRSKLSKASSIAIIGGGSVGAELAGEIKDIWPGKEVTIIHGGKKLLNGTYPDKFRDKAYASIRKRGIEVVLGEYVDNISESGHFKTRSGEEFSADLIIPTWGSEVSAPYLSPSLFDIAPSGEVRVLPTLQLPNHLNIFAGGDMIQWKEQKQAAKALTHGDIIAKNVIKYLNGVKTAHDGLVVYKGSPEMILITNGKNGGYAYMGFLWGIIFGDCLARLIKSRDLLIPKMRKYHGY